MKILFALTLIALTGGSYAAETGNVEQTAADINAVLQQVKQAASSQPAIAKTRAVPESKAAADVVCMYNGKKAIPAGYMKVPKGVFGVLPNDAYCEAVYADTQGRWFWSREHRKYLCTPYSYYKWAPEIGGYVQAWTVCPPEEPDPQPMPSTGDISCVVNGTFNGQPALVIGHVSALTQCVQEYDDSNGERCRITGTTHEFKVDDGSVLHIADVVCAKSS